MKSTSAPWSLFTLKKKGDTAVPAAYNIMFRGGIYSTFYPELSYVGNAHGAQSVKNDGHDEPDPMDVTKILELQKSYMEN